MNSIQWPVTLAHLGERQTEVNFGLHTVRYLEGKPFQMPDIEIKPLTFR